MPFQTITSTRDNGLGLVTSSLQLPNLRSLFPDLLETSTGPTSPIPNSSPSNPFNFSWSSKDLCSPSQEVSDQGSSVCCKPGCNCDTNMLGDNIYFFSKREKLPSISSTSSSPLLATPQSASAGLPAEFVEVAGKAEFESPLSMSQPFGYLAESSGFHKGIANWAFSNARGPLSESCTSAFQKYPRPEPRISWDAEDKSPLIPNQARILQDPCSIDKPVPTTIHKPYRCTYCNKRFARPSSLNTHIYSHTGEKPFECEEEGCNRRFSVLSNLRRHTKLHARSQRGRGHHSKTVLPQMKPESSMAYVGHW